MSSVKRKSTSEYSPYDFNSSISVFYELKHGGDEITVGTPLRFKYQRGTYKFVKMVHNTEKDATWIDCTETATGVYRSFYVKYLKGVVKPKKTRKKINV